VAERFKLLERRFLMSVKVIVIADDLSGAVALGGEFRKTGRNVLVVEYNVSHDINNVDTLVVNTDSRDDTPQQAAAKNRETLLSLEYLKPQWLVKKIDSLLRGHIGAEIAAILSTSVHSRCLIAPAAPRSGRTTINGRQYFAGKPLSEQMSNMDGNADMDSDNILQVIAKETNLQARLLPLDLIQSGSSAIAKCIRESTEPLLVADAATQEDLNAAVAAAAETGVMFVAGTYGIGESVILAEAGRTATPPILAVAGSTSLLTHKQALNAGAMPSCTLFTLSFGKAELAKTPEEIAQIYHDELLELVQNGRHIVLRTYEEAAEMYELWQSAENAGWNRPRFIRHIEACIAETIRPLFGLIGGIAISGGATASAIFRAIGATAFTVEGPEPIPASPVMHIANGKYVGLPCMTKPGAFGEEKDISTMIRTLYLHKVTTASRA